MRLCFVYYPLQKEASLTKVESCITLGRKHKYLQGTLTVRLFSKTIVSSLLGPWVFFFIRFIVPSHPWVFIKFIVPGMKSALWNRPQSNLKVIGYSYNSHATIASVGRLVF